MVKSRFRKGERACRRGEDNDECSIAVGGYVTKTLEVLI